MFKECRCETTENPFLAEEDRGTRYYSTIGEMLADMNSGPPIRIIRTTLDPPPPSDDMGKLLLPWWKRLLRWLDERAD